MRTAIIIVDVQNCFIKDTVSWLPVKIRDYLLETKPKYILFSQFVNSSDSNFVKQLKWTEAFTSPDIDIHPTLSEFITPENVFQKTAYSIFKSKKFTNYLKKNNITDVLICGVDSDACVVATAFDAFDYKYNVRVLTELTASSESPAYHDAALKIITRSIQQGK